MNLLKRIVVAAVTAALYLGCTGCAVESGADISADVFLTNGAETGTIEIRANSDIEGGDLFEVEIRTKGRYGNWSSWETTDELLNTDGEVLVFAVDTETAIACQARVISVLTYDKMHHESNVLSFEE